MKRLWGWLDRVTWGLVRLSWALSIRRDGRYSAWNALNCWAYQHWRSCEERDRPSLCSEEG